MTRNAVVTDRNIKPFRLSLFQSRRHPVSQRQKHGDYDYSESHKLDQIFWSLFVAVSISEETTSACAPGCNGFHVWNTPFVAAFCTDWQIFMLTTLTVARNGALQPKSNAAVTFGRRTAILGFFCFENFALITEDQPMRTVLLSIVGRLYALRHSRNSYSFVSIRG